MFKTFLYLFIAIVIMQSINASSKELSSVKSFSAIPATFEKNQGQTNPGFKYILRQASFNLLLTKDGAMLGLYDASAKKTKNSKLGQETQNPIFNQSFVRIKFLKPNKSAEIKATGKVKTESNYFIGADEKKWVKHVPHFSNVTYSKIYDGIDLTFFADREKLEFDFNVAPGANPKNIKFLIEAEKSLGIDKNGSLIIGTKAGSISLQKPNLFQKGKKSVTKVNGKYKILKIKKSKAGVKAVIGFDIGRYNKAIPLIIDPVIAYSAILGGANRDFGNSIDVDSAKHPYITGITHSIQDFPIDSIIQTENRGSGDVYVLKLDADGSGIIYSTYLGGTGFDYSYSLELDLIGNAHIAGLTESIDNINTTDINEGFPLKNPLQPNFGGGNSDAFVAIINEKGDGLLYSSYFGGSGRENAFLALDNNSNIYISGDTTSTDLPTTASCIQSNHSNPELSDNNNNDAYFVKFAPLGSSQVFSGYTGGRLTSEQVNDIAVDNNENILIVGQSFTLNGFSGPDDGLSLINPIRSHTDSRQGFIVKLKNDCTEATYSTYFGGNGFDSISSIVTDPSGNAYIGGNTALPSGNPEHDFPLEHAFQMQLAGEQDGFMAKISPEGNLLFSSLLGGENGEVLNSIDYNPGNANVFLTGWTRSRSPDDFPIIDAFEPTYLGGDSDGFVTRINLNTFQIVFSSFLGGSGKDQPRDIAVDSDNNIFITGSTQSQTISGSEISQTANSGAEDVFITKITEFEQSINIKPDLLIKTDAQQNFEFAINNVYQQVPEGSQISTQLVGLGSFVKYQIEVDDDSTVNNFNTFFIKARESRGDGWVVSYSFRGQNITDEIRSPSGFRITAGDGIPSDSDTLPNQPIELTLRPVQTTTDRTIPDNPTDIDVGDITSGPFTSLLQKSVTFEVFVDAEDTRVFDSVKAVTTLRVDPP